MAEFLDFELELFLLDQGEFEWSNCAQSHSIPVYTFAYPILAYLDLAVAQFIMKVIFQFD